MRPYIELGEGRLRERVNQRQGIGWKTFEQKEIFKKITDKGGIITSALKMETVCFSETLAWTCQPTQRQNPKQHRHTYRENLNIIRLLFVRLSVILSKTFCCCLSSSTLLLRLWQWFTERGKWPCSH
jgi:hypothetical protein